MKNRKKHSIYHNIDEIHFLLPISCYFFFLSGVIFSSIYYWYLNIISAALCITICTLFTPIVLTLNKCSVSKLIPTNLLVLVYFIALFYTSSVTGQLFSMASFWLLSIPLVANLLLPPLYSLGWLILTTTGCLYLYFFPADQLFSHGGFKQDLVRIFSVIFATGLVYILTLLQRLKIDELSSNALTAKLEHQKISLYENNLNEAIDLAHKMNNPLTAILLLSKRLQKTCEKSQLEHLIAIETEASRCADNSRELIRVSQQKIQQKIPKKFPKNRPPR